MRTDSRNLLERLDQPDFEYREFQQVDERRDGHAWPLLTLVGQALGRPQPVAPAPVRAVSPAYSAPPQPVAPAAQPTATAAGHGFFAHYGPAHRAAPAATEPAPPQDLESLLQSYSVRR